MEKTILIIEDELSLLTIVDAYFKRNNYKTFTASDGLKGLEIFRRHDIDVICCDVMMPIVDGWEVAKSIRQSSDIPIILMTALDSEADQLAGYNLDIDDYITKPFSPSILVAKVNKIVNRYKGDIVNSKSKSIKYGDLEINILSRNVKLNMDRIKLSKTEFDLLEYLVKNESIAINRVTILDEVWGMDVYVEERVVDTNIKVLRKKLKDYGKYIKTVFGVGYMFEYDEKN